MVDVLTETVIARPRAEVAAYAADPTHATAWYANIDSIDWQNEPPATVGSRVAFVARFLGRRLAYTYEIVARGPGGGGGMRTAGAPFPMETTCEWRDAPDGPRMTWRNRGEPAGFGRLAAVFMAPAMRRANRKGLVRLKALLERGA